MNSIIIFLPIAIIVSCFVPVSIPVTMGLFILLCYNEM